MVALKRVLCPVDLSELSIRALAWAGSIAEWYRSDLTVLHVVPTFQLGLGSTTERVVRAAPCPVLTVRPSRTHR